MPAGYHRKIQALDVAVGQQDLNRTAQPSFGIARWLVIGVIIT